MCEHFPWVETHGYHQPSLRDDETHGYRRARIVASSSSREKQFGEPLARWAEHRKTAQNMTRGAADIPGLRPSLDERLGLRPA
jgi:hypothetical protein